MTKTAREFHNPTVIWILGFDKAIVFKRFRFALRVHRLHTELVLFAFGQAFDLEVGGVRIHLSNRHPSAGAFFHLFNQIALKIKGLDVLYW